MGDYGQDYENAAKASCAVVCIFAFSAGMLILWLLQILVRFIAAHWR